PVDGSPAAHAAIAARARRARSSITLSIFGSAAGFTATVISSAPSGDLLRAHVLAADAGHPCRLLHRVAAERLTELLIEDHLDEGRHAFLLRFAGRTQRFRQLGLRLYCHAFQAATFRDLCIAEMRIELGSDEIVVEPEDRIALFRTPLIVAENYHRDAGILLAPDRAHLAHRDSEGAIAGKADHGNIRISDLGADDRGEAVAARPNTYGRKILPPLVEGRVGVADGSVVADVARDDGVLRQPGLDGAPGLPRRHAVGLALARIGIPCRARIVV